jgi:two-component system chemotaxis response regulator CheY
MSGSKNLLLVDDDGLTRQAFGIVLTRQGYTVRGAADGQEALDSLRSGPLPDCILLDLPMPAMSGKQFRTRQRQHKEWAGIPVLVVSGDARGEEEAALMGAAGYLAKPVDVEDLLDAVGKHA